MNNKIFFIAGIHGVGKSTFCNQLSNELNIKHYSASELIKLVLKRNADEKKKVGDIEGNQDILLYAIKSLVKESSIILDGHFCLINKTGSIDHIPLKTFQSLKLQSVLLLHDEVESIVHRLESRDSLKYDKELFNELAEKEMNYAEHVCNTLGVKLFKQQTGTINQEFIDQIKLTRK